MAGPEAAGLAARILGQDLPPAAARHLHAAGLAYQQDEVAERHLGWAEAEAPGHAAVLIGRYRFYFYKGRLAEALAVARDCLARAAAGLRLAEDWRRVAAGDADFASYDSVPARFYLFSLKAYAYLQLRLGNLEEGRQAVAKLLELDGSDKIGARVLLGVLDRAGGPDDA